jgi:hypothetical protein
LGLYAQPGDHGDRIAHLGQGHLEPLMASGGSLPHGSLSRVIHYERLTGARGMGPREGILAQIKPLPEGRTYHTMGGSLAIAPEAALSPNDSSHTRGCAPLPEGLRTMSPRRGPLHHKDGQDQMTEVSSTSIIRKKSKKGIPSGAFHEGQDDLPFCMKFSRGSHGRRHHRQCHRARG